MKKGLLVILAFVLCTTILISSVSVFKRADASSALNVAISEGYFRGIPAGMNFRAFKNAFTNPDDWNWHIYPAGATGKYDYLTDSITYPIYTGCTFSIELSFANVVSYEIVVLGDVNGDGYVNQTDYIALKAHIKNLNGATLTGAKLKAADINVDGKISATDYLRLKRYLCGLYDLNKVYEPDTSETGSGDSTTNKEEPWYTGWY